MPHGRQAIIYMYIVNITPWNYCISIKHTIRRLAPTKCIWRCILKIPRHFVSVSLLQGTNQPMAICVCSLNNLVLYTCLFYHMMFEFYIHLCFIIWCLNGNMLVILCMHFILLPEWFYMYIPAYVLSQAWLNKTVETELNCKILQFHRAYLGVDIFSHSS